MEQKGDKKEPKMKKVLTGQPNQCGCGKEPTKEKQYKYKYGYKFKYKYEHEHKRGNQDNDTKSMAPFEQKGDKKELKVNQRNPKADQKEPKVNKGEPETNLKEQGNMPMKIVGGSNMQMEVFGEIAADNGDIIESGNLVDKSPRQKGHQKEPKESQGDNGQRNSKAGQKELKVNQRGPETDLKEQGNRPMKIVGGSNMQVMVFEEISADDGDIIESGNIVVKSTRQKGHQKEPKVN